MIHQQYNKNTNNSFDADVLCVRATDVVGDGSEKELYKSACRLHT